MFRDLDEQELARLCSQGNRQAEDELYRRYADRLYVLCRRYSHKAADAEDLMQDAFIKALERIQTYAYTGKGSLYGWIRRIAINMALNRIQRQRMISVPLWPSLHDDIPDPSEQDLNRISEEQLLKWISELTDMRMAVFNLYCIDGYSHKEIGEMLGISEKGSAGILAKAKKQLKEKIAHYLKNNEA